MAHFYESIAQCVWPKERLSTRLCAKCGDSFQLDLQALNYNEMLHRVRSGYSPDRSEHSVYSELLENAQQDLDHCQSELRRLRDLWKKMETQRDVLRAYIAGFRSIMSPIHRLPVELMGEIFQYICCGDIGANCILEVGKPRIPTITLSCVCISWYNMVTSMPVLWSSFGSRNLDSSSTPSLFNLFLERSRSHPVEFEIQDDCSEPSIDRFSSLTANKSLNRWRHVRIAATVSFVEGILQSLIDSGPDLPRLVSLCLESEFETEISFPVSCPNLGSLTLDCVYLNLEHPRPSITHLKLVYLNSAETAKVILYCPNLHDLEVRELLQQDNPLPKVSSNTKKFTVDFDSTNPDAPSQFLNSLTFPKLTDLQLSDLLRPPETNLYLAPLCSMLERGQSWITHLTIRFISFTSDELLRLFLHVPLVTTLEVEELKTLHDRAGVYLVLKSLILHHDQGEQEFGNRSDNNGEDRDNSEDGEADDGEDEEKLDKGDKEMGVEVPNGQCLLPRLTELHLVIRPRKELLLQFVRSRWRPSSSTIETPPGDSDRVCVPLQRLYIRYPGDVGKSARKRLEALQESLEEFKEDGMDIEVIIPSKRF